MKYFQILSVNVSALKGVPKKPVERIVLEKDFGIAGDAHAGNWHRQVSLLAVEDIILMNAKSAQIGFGDFAENITTKGIDLASLTVGSHLKIGAAVLEIAQIGKECHTGCAIRRRIGDCIMPRRGVFAKVMDGGEITNESIGTYDF
jgi:MOSC domain-containing protein YiiM